MMRWQIQQQGLTMKGFFQDSAQGLWVHVDGETHLFPPDEVEDWLLSPVARQAKNMARQQKGPSSKAGLICKAPMPGRITKILVSADKEVAVGDVLVVMEAMKMEYTLKAEVSGRVSEILVKVGDQVSLGAELVRTKGLE